MDEARRYDIQSTSNTTSKVRDLVLSESDKGLTRKVLRAEIIDNPNNAKESVKACVVHQKRKSPTDAWDDLDGTTLLQTKPISPSKFPLSSKETKLLFEQLADLYEIGDGGVRSGRVVLQLADEDRIIRTDRSRARIIRKLLESNHGEEVWRLLEQLEPDLVRKLSAALVYDRRTKAVNEFANNITGNEKEEYWRKFLSDNLWMLGGGTIRLLGEARLDISHSLDLPLETEGGFMDIVELKRPDFPFWTPTKAGKTHLYRKKYPVPHHELNGALAQTTSYILQAEKQVANTDFRNTHDVIPLKPRGLVVHGRSDDWGDSEWEAFRLLNDQLHGVQVMTFDHLLSQAKRILRLDKNPG